MPASDVQRRDLDFSSFRALNLPAPVLPAEPLRLGDASDHIWSKLAPESYQLPLTVLGDRVGCFVQTNTTLVTTSLSIPEKYQLSIFADPFDLRSSITVAGDTGKGESRVGLRMGQWGEASNPIWIKTGDHTFSEFGASAKCVPMVLNSPIVAFDGLLDVVDTTRFIAIMMPHTSLISSGPVNVGYACQLYLDGAPDINPQVTLTEYEGGGAYAIFVGGDFCDLGEGILWGQDHAQSTGCYEDVAFGSGAPVAGAGHIRRAFDERAGKQYWVTSVDGGGYRPMVCAMQYTATFDPPSQTYPNGITLLSHWIPNDVGFKGLATIDPKRWTLPPRIAISGGSLTPGIRFTLSTGSTQDLLNPSLDPTSSTSIMRETIDINSAGAFIVSLDFIVNNDSGSTSAAKDIGAFRFEGEVL